MLNVTILPVPSVLVRFTAYNYALTRERMLDPLFCWPMGHNPPTALRPDLGVLKVCTCRGGRECSGPGKLGLVTGGACCN